MEVKTPHALTQYLPTELVQLVTEYNTFKICESCHTNYFYALGCLRCVGKQQKWHYESCSAFSISSHAWFGTFSDSIDQEMFDYVHEVVGDNPSFSSCSGMDNIRWRITVRHNVSKHSHTRAHPRFAYYHVKVYPAWGKVRNPFV